MLETVNPVNHTLSPSTWFATRCRKAHHYRKKKTKKRTQLQINSWLLSSLYILFYWPFLISCASCLFIWVCKNDCFPSASSRCLLPALAHCLHLSLWIYTALPCYRTYSKGQEAQKAKNMNSKKKKKSWATQRPQGCAWVCHAFKGIEVEKSSNIAEIRVLGRLPRSQEKQQTVNGTERRGIRKKRRTDNRAWDSEKRKLTWNERIEAS